MSSLSKTVSPSGWMTLSPWMICLGLAAIGTPAIAQPAQPEIVPPKVSADLGLKPQLAAPGVVSAELAPELTPELAAAEVIAAAEVKPEVTVSASECLADCHPSEPFLFNPPLDLAIPPRASSRSVLVQSPSTAPLFPAPPAAPNSPGSSDSQGLPDQAAPEPTASSPAPSAQIGQAADLEIDPADASRPEGRSRRPLTPPSLSLQGVYLYQGGEGSARLRVTGVYPILPELQVGGSIDFTDGEIFSEEAGNGSDDGLSINELYLAASLPDYPNLRLIVGQIDLTSYFDRNSFAKDSATQFFNPVFATNPALSSAGLASRQGAVVNWTIIDELEVKAAVFSSDRSISDFDLNGFAGEIGGRLGNLILRGTYITSTDSGANTGAEEIFGLRRSNDDFGLRDGDREDGYGLNAEYFIPEINLGLFARYGWYENRDVGEGGTTYSLGVNLLDLFMQDDRLGLGYGRLLSSNRLRDGDNPDVWEAFYDFRILDFLRLGVTFQALDEFSETIAGFRIRTDFDLIPRRAQ